MSLRLQRLGSLVCFDLLFVIGYVSSGQAQQPQVNSSPTRFASVVEPGATISPGELARVTIYYGSWALVCDIYFPKKKRVCVIEQKIDRGGVELQWRIGITADGRPALSFDISPSVDKKTGLALRVGKYVTNIPFEECASTCRAVIPFSGFVQQGVFEGELVGFGFERNGQGQAIAADMRGFKEVMAAAKSPPEITFGAAASAQRRKPAQTRTPPKTP